MRLVMDRGFYKDEDIALLLKKRTKFIIGVPFTTNLAKDAVADARAEISRPDNAIAAGDDLVYAKTTVINLHSRRAYLHVYYNEKQHISKRAEFLQKLIQTEEGLRNGAVKKAMLRSKNISNSESQKTGFT